MNEVLSFYHLNNPKCFNYALGGYLNKNIVVEADEGIFFLQGVENNKRPVEEEVKVINFLRGKNFPVSKMITNKNGNILTFWNSQKYLLSEFIEGHSPNQFNDLNDKHLVNAAKSLAKLHQLLANYEGVPFSNPNTALPHEAKKICQNVKEIIQKKINWNQIDLHVNKIISRKINLLNNLPKIDLSNCPKQFVHGDYHGANLIFDENDEVKGIVDWEYFGHDYRIWEVVRSMAFICDIDYTGSLAGPIDLEKARKYLQAYDEINPLTDEEIKIIPDILEYQAICCVFSLEQHYLKQRSECDIFLPKKPENWFWFVDNKDKIDKEVASKIRHV